MQQKFVVDAMLGRLAKWLRILGHDAVYYNDSNFFRMVRAALSENRIILTRNKKFGHHIGIKIVLINSESLKEQMKQVINEFKLTSVDILSRCIVCNVPVEKVDRELVKERVPEHALNTQDKFYRCFSCQRVYWSGSHVEEVKKMLEKFGE